MNWQRLDTQGRLDAIRAVYQPGMSAGKIAAAIGKGVVTRNAIIGMYTRHRGQMMDCPLTGHGVEKSMTPKAQKHRAQRTQKRQERPSTRMTAIGMGFRAERLVAAPLPFKPRLVCEGVLPPRNLTMMDLERNDCRWAVNDPEPGETFLFCGNAKDGASSYCAGHRRLAFGEGTASERVAHKALLKRAA